MNSLSIIGAGPLGRECRGYAIAAGWSVSQLVDLNNMPATLEGLCVCALGDPTRRLQLAHTAADKGARFATLIHPSAYIGPNVKIGEGSIIAPQVTLSCDISLGRHVIVDANASIAHDCLIGDGCYIGQGCHLGGRCSLAPGTYLPTGTILQHDTRL